jgi:hypothetical protein
MPSGDLLEVHADREVLLAGAAEDHRAYPRVIRQARDLGLQGVHELEPHAVSRGIVDHEGLDGTLAFDEQRTARLLAAC